MTTTSRMPTKAAIGAITTSTKKTATVARVIKASRITPKVVVARARITRVVVAGRISKTPTKAVAAITSATWVVLRVVRIGKKPNKAVAVVTRTTRAVVQVIRPC